MTTGNPSKRKLIVAAILAFGVTPVLMAENAWRVWTGGDSVAGGDGIWTADSLTWSARDDGAGTQYSQYRDKLKFPGGPATIEVGERVEIEGTTHLLSEQLTFGGEGSIAVFNGLTLTAYPDTSTTINCPILMGEGKAIAINMPNSGVDIPATFRSAIVTINSDLTISGRLTVYHGTLIMNGNVTVTASNCSIGSYSGNSGFYGRFQINGVQSGAAGYTVSPDSFMSGTGTVNNTANVNVYGCLQPGGFDTLGTLTLNSAWINFYDGAKLDFRVDLTADKADKLVCGSTAKVQCKTVAGAAVAGATVRIHVSGKTSARRTYQLYEIVPQYKYCTFNYEIEKEPSCTAEVSFDEATGLLTVDPPKNAGLILFVR